VKTAHPQRIHVIGIPGSGKSTLAARCATALGVPSIDLDYLALPESPAGTQLQGPTRYDASQRAATAVAGQDRWVTDGVYCGWTEPLLERADLIIWLDISPVVAVARIVRRHARRSLARQNDFPGVRLLTRFSWGVLRDAAKPAASTAQLRADMNHNSRATTAAHLDPYRDKVIRCRTRRDVTNAVARASSTGS
jgi:adenylate kinase family enzyme